MTAVKRMIVESHDIESIMNWFEDEITEGENGIWIYPNSPTFREIYTQYAKNLLTDASKGEDKKQRGQHYQKQRRGTTAAANATKKNLAYRNFL